MNSQSSSTPTDGEYLDFLLEVLQAVHNSKGDPTIVHPILKENLNKLDLRFAEVLRVWTTETLAEAQPELSLYIGINIFTFCNLLLDFLLGNRAKNIEIIIVGYKIVLTAFNRQDFPELWGNVQTCLGNAYKERIDGEYANNLEIAIAYSQEALTECTRERFPQIWALSQYNLGNAYYHRIRGERSESIETAIFCFQEALQEYTRNANPYGWSMILKDMGAAYSDRIRGEKAENIETAIYCYQESLKGCTPEAFSQSWAAIQINLGNAYSNRIRGEKAENIEIAIACYEEALRESPRDRDPSSWAWIHMSLAKAYNDRIRGEQADNWEKAIACGREALEEFTCDRYPRQWATTQNNLGISYSNRIRGEHAENLEIAIACYQESLKVRTREGLPYDWARTQNSLGNTYTKRIRGEQAENSELAIACHQQALQEFSRDRFAEQWALTQINLGNAYSQRKRIRGEEAENMEMAIACYEEALKEFSRDRFPEKWAETLDNLGDAYLFRIRGEKAENIEIAIAYFQEVLKEYTRESFPKKWATTQNSLGISYRKRIYGERTENLEKSIAFYQEALKEDTRESFPEYYADTLFNLGLAYQDAQRLQEAYNTFKDAINTVDEIRGEIISGDESKRKQAERWNRLYLSIVETCLELGNITKAIEYVERSKTRNLVELILERDSKTIFPQDIFTQLEQLRDEIAVGQDKIQNGNAENIKALTQHLQQLRQQRNKLQDEYLPVAAGFTFDRFQTTLDEQTAIIEWYINDGKLETFIITHDSFQRLNISPSDNNLNTLMDWIDEYLEAYYNSKTKWIDNLNYRLTHLTEILQIEEILKLIPKNCSRLILIPHRYLHLLPLHALSLTNGELLYEKFPDGVSYAPSCQLLQQVQQRKRPNFKSLFAIQNPTCDLNYTDLEVQVIQSYFKTSNVLKKTAATLTAINNSDLNTYHCAHFSCHGYFNLTNPGKSALILANTPIADTPTKPDSERYLTLRVGETHDLEKCLTLDKIFSLKLEKCRLVTLSACETGLIDFNNTSDEYIGLPSGFLLVGSPSVVSSLWTVDDLSTSFLMIKLYENLFKIDNAEAGDVAIALKQAQTWLRNLTIEGLDTFLEEHKPQIDKVLAQLRVGQRIRFQESLKLIKQRQPLPFASPYYWAGFTASGR
ncbi:MAG: CHAT domain-containing protein [Nostoc sp. SerVER01]|nr:CHAT domain-containing tetratricopeptide repeat protein [Nostoc sp. SerVER01]